VKLVRLVPVPVGLTTLTTPVAAPTGTVVVIEVREATLNLAFTPLNVT